MTVVPSGDPSICITASSAEPIHASTLKPRAPTPGAPVLPHPCGGREPAAFRELAHPSARGGSPRTRGCSSQASSRLAQDHPADGAEADDEERRRHDRQPVHGRPDGEPEQDRAGPPWRSPSTTAPRAARRARPPGTPAPARSRTTRNANGITIPAVLFSRSSSATASTGAPAGGHLPHRELHPDDAREREQAQHRQAAAHVPERTSRSRSMCIRPSTAGTMKAMEISASR